LFHPEVINGFATIAHGVDVVKVPLPDKETLEKSFGLWLDARRNPSLETWTSLADETFVQTFGEDEGSEPEDHGGDLQELLHALVEVSWEAWNIDCDRMREAMKVGLFGDESGGTPPFLSPRMGYAHIELGVLQSQVGELMLSDDARALGDLLLIFNLSEGFIRPGMAMATFLLHIMTGNATTVEAELRMDDGRGGVWYYRRTRERFIDAITSSLAENGHNEYLLVLDRWMNREVDGTIMNLSDLRNAVGHQDFSIEDGTTKLNWTWHAKSGDPGKVDILTLEQLEEGLGGLRSLAMTFIVWEGVMASVLRPADIPDDVDGETMAKEVLEGLGTMRKIAWPFLQ